MKNLLIMNRKVILSVLLLLPVIAQADLLQDLLKGKYKAERMSAVETDSVLNGKTLYPFTTHEGSGLGSCVSDLKKAYPNADVKKGFSMYGHEVRSNRAKVENWIKGLGL